MKKFEITEEQLLKIGNYLYVKPMNEVEELVGIIRNLKVIDDSPKQCEVQDTKPAE